MSAVCRTFVTILMLAVGAVMAPAQTASFSGVQSPIGNNLAQPYGVAVDASGNIYISDIGGSAPLSDTVVKETLSNGTYTQSTVTSGLSINSPNSVAVDASGNVYIANTGNGNILMETPSGSSYMQNVIASGLNNPNAVAVDGSGNVYVAVTNGGTSTTGSIVILTPAGGGMYTQSTIAAASGLMYPQGIAVDGSGNVYVANTVSGTVLKETPSSGSYTQSTLVTGLNNPDGLAVDGSGNIYIAENGSSLVLKETAMFGGGYAQSVIGTGLSSPKSVAVDGSGNVYIADTNVGALKVQTAGVNFGTAAIVTGTPATPTTPTMLTLPFTFATAGTIATPVVVTEGATKNAQGASLDFADAKTGTCNTTPSQSVGSTCTVNVTFTPTAAGARYGAVTLLNSSGNVIATAFVFGTGQGPQINFLPGTQSTIGSGLSAPVGTAVDGSGNIYIADSNNKRVLKETLSGGVYTQSTIISGLGNPFGVAVDGSGNVYVSDIGNDDVLLETPSNGTYTQSTITSGFSINSPNAVAVDGSGNVYIANTNNSNVLKETLSNGIYTQSTIASGLSNPNGVAVDANGNVYVVLTNGGSGSTGGVLILTPSSGGNYTQSTLSAATGLSFPQGITVDGNGNVYIADSNNARVLKEMLSGGTYTQSVLPATGLNQPKGLAVDGSGNVYISNNGSSVVLKEDYADAPALTFATPTAVGSTDTADGAMSVQIENIGNQTLTNIAPGLVVAANFAQVPGSGTPADCTAAFSLAADASCNISVEFEPATNTANGSVTLTDNNLNAAPSTTQTIPLISTVQGTLTITPATLPAATVGTAYSATLTASGGTSPYTYAISAGALPGGITLTGGVLAGTPNTTGTFSFSVTATDSTPAPGAITGTVMYTLTVNAAVVVVPTITITPATLTAATAGTAYSATLTASGGVSPYTYTLTSGALPAGITLTGGVLAGTPTAIGTFNFTVAATDSSPAPGPYMGTAMYTLTVNPGVATTFAFTPSGATTATVAAGAAAMYSFSLAPSSAGIYPGTVSFAVTGLPAGATATFGPFTVAPTYGPTTVTMTVQTAAATAQNRLSPIGRGFVLALLLLPFGMKRSLRKKLNARMLLLLLLLAGTTAAMSGCGGSKNSSSGNGSSTMSGPQTYTLTVTATSGAATQSQTFMLTVQ
jgi:sugar lactone lactonase YvrE